MKRSIANISLANRKQPRIAMPCLYRRVVPQQRAEEEHAAAPEATSDPPATGEGSQQLQVEVTQQLQVEVTVEGGQNQPMARMESPQEPAVVEPEPEPVVSPLIKAAALINKMIDRRDIEGCYAKCVELVAEDPGAFVHVALSLRSLRSREQRHVVGQLLAQLLEQRLINPPHIVSAINQVLGSKCQTRIIVRGYADMLAPLFVEESGSMSVLSLLSSLDCLSVKQLEKLHDSIGHRLRDLVGTARARLLLPPAIDWAAFKEHQNDSLPSSETVRERRPYIRARCRELDCMYVSTSINNLRHHLTNIHHMNLPESRLRFAKTSEFSEWLANLERTDGVQFVRDHLSNYVCSWRGVDPSRRSRGSGGSGYGSGAAGLVCTAGFYAKSQADGGVEVSAFLTHYHQTAMMAYSVVDSHFLDGSSGGAAAAGAPATGDDQLTDVVFIEGGLDELERDVVAAAAATAISTDHVIDDMRRGFALFETPGHAGDMNVVLYKEPQVAVANSDVWRLEDFALSMASDEQLQRLSQYGGNVLCLSGAEDTPEGSVFHLITISVVDDLLDGWPVVWLLSNRCDEHIVSELIKHVGAAMDEKRLVFRAPLVLLTDSSALHRGWCSATDTNSRLFICPWHVQLAWENALPLIQVDERCDQVRSQLLQLLRSSSSALSSSSSTLSSDDSLQRVRELTLSLLKDPLTQMFGKYFRDSWLPRQHEWAGSQLALLVANADLVVRGLQRSTEDVTVGRTNNTSIAGCVQELLQYLTERMQDSQLKGTSLDPAAETEGAAVDVSGFLSSVEQHHQSAVAILQQQDGVEEEGESEEAGGKRVVEVVQVEDGAATSLAPIVWEIRDSSQPEQSLTVEQWSEDFKCPLAVPCHLVCPACCRLASSLTDVSGGDAGGKGRGDADTAVCVHQYSCSCPLTSPCTTLCPHIHLVHMHRLRQLRQLPDSPPERADQHWQLLKEDSVSDMPVVPDSGSAIGQEDVSCTVHSDEVESTGLSDRPDVAATIAEVVASVSAAGHQPLSLCSAEVEAETDVNTVADLPSVPDLAVTLQADVADLAVDEEPSGTTLTSSDSSLSEKRVHVANNLLALAVEVDRVPVSSLPVWQHCVDKMHATLDVAEAEPQQTEIQEITGLHNKEVDDTNAVSDRS